MIYIYIYFFFKCLQVFIRTQKTRNGQQRRELQSPVQGEEKEEEEEEKFQNQMGREVQAETRRAHVTDGVGQTGPPSAHSQEAARNAHRPGMLSDHRRGDHHAGRCRPQRHDRRTYALR